MGLATKPLARSADLFVDTIGDELLVYDMTCHRAHSLNDVSAAVWKACDGTRSREQIAADTGLDLAAVELALDNLSDIELISGHQRTGISRRTALRRITVGAAGLTVGAAAAGGIAAALPVIRSIHAPSAAMATSGGKAGNSCTTPDNSMSSCSSTSHCSYYSHCVPGAAIPRNSACTSSPQCGFSSFCVAGKCSNPSLSSG